MSGSLGFECNSCGTFRIYSVDDSPEINCASCKKNMGTVGDIWSLENSCPFCDCQSYYKRKDCLGWIVLWMSKNQTLSYLISLSCLKKFLRLNLVFLKYVLQNLSFSG